jgi:anti-sigma28 factor (negative regulator of flagellin synthesis)
MSIAPIGSNPPITRLQGSKATETVPAVNSQDVSPAATDTVDISDRARYLAVAKNPPLREEKVQAMKDLIASGHFETPERINGTVDRLLQELNN